MKQIKFPRSNPHKKKNKKERNREIKEEDKIRNQCIHHKKPRKSNRWQLNHGNKNKFQNSN